MIGYRSYNATDTVFTEGVDFTLGGVVKLDLAPKLADPKNTKVVFLTYSTGFEAARSCIFNSSGGGLGSFGFTQTSIIGRTIALPVTYSNGQLNIAMIVSTGTTPFRVFVTGELYGDGVVQDMTFSNVSFTADAWRTNTVPNIVSGDSGNIEAVIISHVTDNSGGKSLVSGYRGVGNTDNKINVVELLTYARIVQVNTSNQFQTYRQTSAQYDGGEGLVVGYIKSGHGYHAQDPASNEITIATPYQQYNTQDVTTQTSANARSLFGYHYQTFLNGDTATKQSGTRGVVQQTAHSQIYVQRMVHQMHNDLNEDSELDVFGWDVRTKLYVDGYLDRESPIIARNSILKAQNSLIKSQ